MALCSIFESFSVTRAKLGQLLQTMARVLANVEQGIEQLKAGQERMASDNAKVDATSASSNK